MKSIPSLLCAIGVAALAVTGAQAQSTREAVKNDGKSAATSTPASGGEMSTPKQDRGGMQKPSQTTRDDVKADRDAARATGTATPSGEQSTPNQAKGSPKPAMSTESRSDVKADAKASSKNKETPEGQISQKGQEKGITKP